MLTPEEAKQLVVDSWTSTLTPADQENLDAFLETNPEFRDEASTLRENWISLENWEETPAPHQVRQRFYSALEEHTTPNPDAGKINVASWWRQISYRPAFQLAAAVTLLLTGVFIGRTGSNDSSELAHLQNDVNQLNQLVTLSMLQQSTASKRLAAIERSEALGEPNEELVNVLLDIVAYDPNINVRLAALDVLSPVFSKDRTMRDRVWTAALEQDSPLVKATLVEMLAASPDEQTRSILETLLTDKTDSVLVPQVRRAIESLGPTASEKR